MFKGKLRKVEYCILRDTGKEYFSNLPGLYFWYNFPTNIVIRYKLVYVFFVHSIYCKMSRGSGIGLIVSNGAVCV
jgi:hypothetical protein